MLLRTGATDGAGFFEGAGAAVVEALLLARACNFISRMALILGCCDMGFSFEYGLNFFSELVEGFGSR